MSTIKQKSNWCVKGLKVDMSPLSGDQRYFYKKPPLAQKSADSDRPWDQYIANS
jgi:hypothetical protein